MISKNDPSERISAHCEDYKTTKDWPFKKETTFVFGQFTTISGHFLPTTYISFTKFRC